MPRRRRRAALILLLMRRVALTPLHIYAGGEVRMQFHVNAIGKRCFLASGLMAVLRDGYRRGEFCRKMAAGTLI